MNSFTKSFAFASAFAFISLNSIDSFENFVSSIAAAPIQFRHLSLSQAQPLQQSLVPSTSTSSTPQVDVTRSSSASSACLLNPSSADCLHQTSISRANVESATGSASTISTRQTATGETSGATNIGSQALSQSRQFSGENDESLEAAKTESENSESKTSVDLDSLFDVNYPPYRPPYYPHRPYHRPPYYPPPYYPPRRTVSDVQIIVNPVDGITSATPYAGIRRFSTSAEDESADSSSIMDNSNSDFPSNFEVEEAELNSLFDITQPRHYPHPPHHHQPHQPHHREYLRENENIEQSENEELIPSESSDSTFSITRPFSGPNWSEHTRQQRQRQREHRHRQPISRSLLSNEDELNSSDDDSSSFEALQGGREFRNYIGERRGPREQRGQRHQRRQRTTRSTSIPGILG